MREPRNPFALRASEQIESDTTFARLFGPGVLDVLPSDRIWDNTIQIFRSAPGGGKTSLFRAFTPSVLLALHAARAVDDYRDLHSKMKELGAVSDSGPLLLGVMLSCARNYAALQDLSFDPSRKQQLFFSLLNARMILAALRGSCEVKRLRYPDDLDRLVVRTPPGGHLPVRFPVPGSGRSVFEWARMLESRVFEAIDSFDPPADHFPEGHETLDALSLLRSECITLGGQPIAGRVVVMFDDVHKLAKVQRHTLLATLFDMRPAVNVWLAERFEALSPEELMAEGASTGREYGTPIILEDVWRTSSKRFENAVASIADRRVRSARDVEMGSFAPCLQDSLDGSTWERRFDDILPTIVERVKTQAGPSPRYREWVTAKETEAGVPRERAVAWRILEIAIERDKHPRQLRLDLGDPLPAEHLDQLESSAVRAAAERYLAEEFGLPYYFGFGRLASIASFNIEQFLAFGKDLFEDVLSAQVLRESICLPPERQEAIIKATARARWDEIPRRVPHGRDARRFLEAMGSFLRWEWEKGRASYGAGGAPTGIALSTLQRDQLLSSSSDQKYSKLLSILSSCVKHHLLEVSPDRTQGQRGKTWTLMYLNRWLCVYFGLPLQYGGWRPKRLEELNSWLERGFVRPSKNAEGTAR